MCLRRMAEVGFISKEEEAAALRQPVKLKPWRPDWIKECGYFNEHVRTLLENRFGREQVFNLGLKVYTTADVGLHQAAQEAINQGIAGLIQRNGYRGPLRHLKGKELTAFQERQIRFYRKYPPRKGQLATVLVSQRDRRSQGLSFRMGDHQGVMEGGSRGPEPGRQPDDVLAARGRGPGAPGQAGPPPGQVDGRPGARAHGAGGPALHGAENRQSPGHVGGQGFRRQHLQPGHPGPEAARFRVQTHHLRGGHRQGLPPGFHAPGRPHLPAGRQAGPGLGAPEL